MLIYRRLLQRIDDLDAARAWFESIAATAQEVAVIVYLDPKWIIIGMRHILSTTDRVAPQIRMIASDAIAFQATGILMAHNHPSGDPTPSAADLDFTRILTRGLTALDVRLVDHLVIAGDRIVSLRAEGLL